MMVAVEASNDLLAMYTDGRLQKLQAPFGFSYINDLTGRFYVKENLYGHHPGYRLRYSRKGPVEKKQMEITPAL